MKKILVLLLTLVVCLSGCSSASGGPTDNITFGFENGQVRFKGDPVVFTEYEGYMCKIDGGTGGLNYSMILEMGNDFTTHSWNTVPVLEENMDKHKDKVYYSEYQGSKVTMMEQTTADYITAIQVYTKGTDKNQVAIFAAGYLDKIPLTEGYIYIDCGSFVAGNDFSAAIVRPTEYVIPGVMRISAPTFSCSGTTTLTVGKKSVEAQTGSSEKYDYYIIDGVQIQLAKGCAIDEYIKLK